MDSFNERTGFGYNPNSNTMSTDGDGDSEEELGVLEIYVHHARNIHNICIYDNQDVYAKFSLTYNPDETHSTRIINGGGKNPEFNEKLVIKLAQLDALLKCEIWMLSRVRNYLEDQLLGFALVPVSQVVGKGKVTQDYSLSSTDLFHSPAGTVKLSLSFNTITNPSSSSSDFSISPELVLLDSKISEVILDPLEYSRIEFPDINVVTQNHQMVSEFFNGLVPKPCSFLHLGRRHHLHDCEMTTSSSNDRNSTTTSLTDDRNSSDSIDKKTPHSSVSISTAPGTPTSKGGETKDEEEEEEQEEEEEGSSKDGAINLFKFSNTNLEAEQSAMQQQIVDMYMRSMQQFTESLAKMKLPMDLKTEDGGDLIQSNSNKLETEKMKKKDGSRVFYGSRAFF